jgi:periplasmic protein TonB
MHNSSLPESADITPRQPSERPKLRPLVGVPDSPVAVGSRRQGAIFSVLSHALIILLLILPALFHKEITAALTDGAGGPGAAGGGGGGRGGGVVIPERIQRYQLPPAPPPPKPATPSVLPPVVKPPEVKPPEPKVETPPTPTPAPATPAPAAAPAPATAPGTGTGAGEGKDNSAGNGPGTGGGTGSGVGTGTGSSVGPGTGGGNATIYPPTPRALFVPPNGVPGRLKKKTIVIELDIDETGKVLNADFSPRSGNGDYDEQFLASLREQRFRPAVRANGQPVPFKYRYEILL